QRPQYGIGGGRVAVVRAAERRRELRRVVRLEREGHVVVVPHHRFEGREGAVVHVRRRELDVAQRCHAEGELVEGLVREIGASAVERRGGRTPRAELRHARVREAPPAEQRPVVAGRALRLPEEQPPATLLLSGQRRVVVAQVAVERRVGLGEGLHLEGRQRGSGVLEAELAGGRARESAGEL